MATPDQLRGGEPPLLHFKGCDGRIFHTEYDDRNGRIAEIERRSAAARR
jgi:hypothetical protein